MNKLEQFMESILNSYEKYFTALDNLAEPFVDDNGSTHADAVATLVHDLEPLREDWNNL